MKLISLNTALQIMTVTVGRKGLHESQINADSLPTLQEIQRTPLFLTGDAQYRECQP